MVTVIANGIKIHYYRTGGNKPQVVINHGAGDDGLCWTRVAMELEKDYDLILPDARGHGKSASGKKDYSTQARVADLLGLIQELKLDRPVVGGHSMGAETSLHLAAEYPSLTRGIFLEDPPIILPGEIMGNAEQSVKMEDIGKMMAKFMRLFKLMPSFIGRRMARKASPTYPDTEIIPWVNSKKRVSTDFLNFMAYHENGYLRSLRGFPPDHRPRLIIHWRPGKNVHRLTGSCPESGRSEPHNPGCSPRRCKP